MKNLTFRELSGEGGEESPDFPNFGKPYAGW